MGTRILVFLGFMAVSLTARSQVQNCVVGVVKVLTPKYAFQSTSYVFAATGEDPNQLLIKKSLTTSTSDALELERRIAFVKNCQKYALLAQMNPERYQLNFYSEESGAYSIDGSKCLVTIDEGNYNQSYCALKTK